MAAETFYYYAGWCTKIEGETIPVPGNYLNYTLREPYGVCGIITPWNFPLLMVAWKLAPALACGNTAVLKIAEETPLSGLRLGQLCQEAGFPDGVVNVVPGFGETAGRALVAHPGVDKISFTGSTAVGKEIVRASADTLKKVSLELGGKSPNIIFADADIDAAVKGAFNGIFYGKGEVCNAGSRLFVEKSVHDRVMDKLLERARKLVPGDPLDPKTRLGALVSKAQMERVLEYVRIGKDEGAPPFWKAAASESAAASSSQPFSMPWTHPCGSPRRRFSARCSPCLRLKTWTNSSKRPTPRFTASPPASGRETSGKRTRWPGESRQEQSGSTPTARFRPRLLSEDTSSPASAANSADMGLTCIRKSNPCGWRWIDSDLIPEFRIET